MNMEEYVTLALQNCMNTMIDCLYYYHMTDGKPELADFVKKNDKKSILEYCISCEQELLAKYELLYILFPKQTIRDIIKDRVNLLSVGESQKIPCYELAQIVFS